MNRSVAIVIPVYKSVLDRGEWQSLQQCMNVFASRPFVIVHPQGLDLAVYRKIFPQQTTYKPFSPDFFTGIDSYNRLLLDKVFYKTFAQYGYILIYQTDAYTFADELDHWTKQPYDYFGAPIIEGKTENGFEFMPHGGNGGFSLRKVESHLRVLKKYKILASPKEVIKYYRRFHKGFGLWLRSPMIFAGFFGFRNNSKYMIGRFGANEDMFWSKRAMEIDKKYRPAPVETEMAFAFEREPSALFAINQQKLPFGCHAWERYEPDFWKQFMPSDAK